MKRYLRCVVQKLSQNPVNLCVRMELKDSSWCEKCRGALILWIHSLPSCAFALSSDRDRREFSLSLQYNCSLALLRWRWSSSTVFQFKRPFVLQYNLTFNWTLLFSVFHRPLAVLSVFSGTTHRMSCSSRQKIRTFLLSTSIRLSTRYRTDTPSR